jgi:hypothetical protein
MTNNTINTLNSKITELKKERDYFLDRVGVDNYGVYLAAGNTKLDKAKSLTQLRKALMEQTND